MRHLVSWPNTTHGQRLNVEDEEVKGEGEDDGSQQPEVDPWRHPDQGLVLRKTSLCSNKSKTGQ